MPIQPLFGEIGFKLPGKTAFLEWALLAVMKDKAFHLRSELMNTSLKKMLFTAKAFSAYASSLMPLIAVDLRL
jgi:hypothetical protein